MVKIQISFTPVILHSSRHERMTTSFVRMQMNHCVVFEEINDNTAIFLNLSA